MYKPEFTKEEFEKITAFQEQAGEQALQNKQTKKSFSDITVSELCDILRTVYGDTFDGIDIRPGFIKDEEQTFLATTTTHCCYENEDGIEMIEDDMLDYITLTPTTLGSMNYEMSDKDIEIYQNELAQRGY